MTGIAGSFLLRPTAGVSIDRNGRRLLGGSPRRMMTLTGPGMELVAGWFEGNPIGPEPAHRALAHRLIEADLATPVGNQTSTGTESVLVVVPVKNDTVGLEATLASLQRTASAGRRPGPGTTELTAIRRIVIVDDGSEPAVDAAVGREVDVPITVVRRSTTGGPGNARNLGLRVEDAPVVVFVDAGVAVTGDQLTALAAELQLGKTIAVAPRIRSEVGPSRLARYEQRWSPLDLGIEPGLVGPGRRISYVPSTCLAVQAAALTASGGFDPDLRFGEDVDLVWRLGSLGWVRYVPAIEVTHPPRSTVGGFVRQRFRYGTSAGPLARRHGRSVAPIRLDSRSAATWAALLTGFRRPAALVAGTATAVYVAKLTGRGVPPSRAASLVSRGWLGTTGGLALATARAWWPLAVVAAIRPRFRTATLLLVAGWLRRVRRRPSEHRCSRPDTTIREIVVECSIDVALGVLDDSAYGLGVWRGSLRERTAVPLLPHIAIGRDATGR